MSFLIQKTFTFEAAHQLETAVTAACHECVHGHSYRVEMTLVRRLLGDHAMVLDFAELRGFKDEVMERWDHGVLFYEGKRPVIQPLIDKGVWKASKVNFLLANPTAEVMARTLFYDLVAYLKRKGIETVQVKAVKVWETASGAAEYTKALS